MRGIRQFRMPCAVDYSVGRLVGVEEAECPVRCGCLLSCSTVLCICTSAETTRICTYRLLYKQWFVLSGWGRTQGMIKDKVL